MNKSIDETDLKILAELDLNTRTTYSEISRKLSLNSNTIASRINHLEDGGVIKGYTVVVDTPGLDYLGYLIYIKLQYANTATEQEIMEYLAKSPITSFCSRIRGNFDIINRFWAKSQKDFEAQWHELKARYGQYIREAKVAPYFGFVQCSFPFTKHMHKENAKNMLVGSNGQSRISQLDRAILRILCADSRTPISEIAKRVNLTPSAVKYRIDRLWEKKVIAGFRPVLDMEKLGYTHYKADFNLHSQKRLEELEQYVLKDEHVDRLAKTASKADLEVGIYAKTAREFDGLMGRIRDEFSDEMQDYISLSRCELAKDASIL